MHQFQQFNQGQYVFLVSNRFWFHYVYGFSLLIKVFQFLLGFRHWRYNHALRVVDGMTFEQLAHGQDSVSLDEWCKRQKRTVMVFKPLQPFAEVPVSRYGYFDIPQIVLHYIRLKLRTGHGWNGASGVGKYSGLFCSEEVAAALGRKDSHLILPCQIPAMDELELIGVFQTDQN